MHLIMAFYTCIDCFCYGPSFRHSLIMIIIIAENVALNYPNFVHIDMDLIDIETAKF